MNTNSSTAAIIISANWKLSLSVSRGRLGGIERCSYTPSLLYVVRCDNGFIARIALSLSTGY